MDSRLIIPDTPRPGVPPGLADLPLFTLAWRALKASAGHPTSHSAQSEEDHLKEKKHRQALLALVNEVFRLQNSGLSSAASVIIERIEKVLLDLGLEIVAPVGEVYSEGLMEVLDNLAQQPTPGLDEARVQEVIVPTILFDGEIAQIGKAVIAVPERSQEFQNERALSPKEREAVHPKEQETASPTNQETASPEEQETEGFLRQADLDRRLMNEINKMRQNILDNDQTERSGGENG